MNNERFNFQPIADTDGITKILNLSAADLKVPARVRTVADVLSLASYLCKWGKPERTVVYCADGIVTAILDEVENDDKVILSMEMTRKAKIWLPVLKGHHSFNHIDFKEFLEDRYPEVEDGATFFAAMSNLSLAATITYDGKLDNNRNYAIKIESNDSASVSKLPKYLNIQIPVWKGLQDPDAAPGTDKAYTFPAKLIFKGPSESRKVPSFALECESLQDVLDQAERDIVAQVRKQLEGWQVLNGAPGSTRA